jgi:hypothetical protein
MAATTLLSLFPKPEDVLALTAGLRRTLDGNILLHAFNADKREHRSYRVDRIAAARTTHQTFVPRYAIELSPQGPMMIAPSAARNSSCLIFRRSASRLKL